jgi:hypothetical protein
VARLIHLDFAVAWNMACRDLPEGWSIDINLEKGSGWLDLWQPNGEKYDLNTADMGPVEQLMAAIAAAKAAAREVPDKPNKKRS